MALFEIKEKVVSMLQSLLSLDSSERIEALTFLKDYAEGLGLEIPKKDKTSSLSCNVINTNNDQVENDSGTLFTVNTVKDLDPQHQNDNNQLNKSKFVSVEGVVIDKNRDSNEKEQTKFTNNHVTEKSLKKSLEFDNTTDLCFESIKNNFSEKSNNPQDLDSKKIIVKSKTPKKNKIPKIKKEDSGNKDGIFKCPGCLITCKSKSALLLHFSSHPRAPMSCRLCRSSFNNILNFWRHRKKKECTRSLFKCSECSEKFKYRRHYLKHVLGHNDNNCKFCDEKFSTWLLYKHHLKKNHPEVKMERDLIPCKFCSMSFRRHLGLYNHYQVEHSKGKFVCLSCGLLLPTKEKYKEHALFHESEKTWKCKICKMKFYRRQQLLFHVSVHKSGTYKCLTCDITVTSQADLYKHKKEGHEVKGLEPKFKCEICHKHFKKKFILKTHMATHSKEKEFYCKYCVKSFSTLGALQKHQKRKSHFEKAKIILPESKYEKIYEDKLICENCGKQYKTQRELTWHLRVHKSVYECDECGKTFTLKVNLTKHIKLHSKKSCVVCELCGNTFNQLSALNEHNLMKHSDVRSAECEICKKKFKRNSELNRHRRIHEQKRPFVCFCGATFSQSSHMQTHYKSFHSKNGKQDNSTRSKNLTNTETNEVFGEPMMDRQKQLFLNNEQTNFISLNNVEVNSEYRNSNSYVNVQVNEDHEGKACYVNHYSLRFPQNEMDPLSVTYDDLNFSSQTDKRDMVYSDPPAVDLSMVPIPDVVPSTISLEGPRDISETVQSFNKIQDDASHIQLVNLSEHIVQEYLLNLP